MQPYPVVYRVHVPLLGVKSEAHSPTEFLTIPAGSEIKLAGEPNGSGLVPVVFGGVTVQIFWRDLNDRGEPVRLRAV